MEYLVLFRIRDRLFEKGYQFTEYYKIGFNIRRKAVVFINEFNEKINSYKIDIACHEGTTYEPRFEWECIILSYYICEEDYVKKYFKKELPDDFFDKIKK